jgi:hypothetical protein
MVRRLRKPDGADFILDIWCDGLHEDSEKDISFRHVALNFLRGALNPQSSLYLEKLAKPQAAADRGGKNAQKRQAGASVSGTANSVATIPAAAASPAAPSSSTGAAASSSLSAADAAAEKARFDEAVRESVVRQMQVAHDLAQQHMHQQFQMAQQHQMAFAAQRVQPHM